MPLKRFLLIAILFFCGALVFFVFKNNSVTYHAEEVVIPIAKEEEKSTDFIVTGDIMLGRFVEVLMDGNGMNYPFEEIGQFLNSVSFVVGNLEGPIVENHAPTPSLTFTFSFASSTADILKKNNISVVSLANNHALDQEHLGYEDTKKYLHQAGIEYFGHPVSVGNISVLRKNVQGKNIVFIGFNATWPYEEKLFEDLIKKESLSGDLVFVVIHWGEEYKLISNDEQKKLAYMFIESGAHAVFGHHPHVTQEIEEYKGRPIFYSLGNFIFDQYFSDDVKEGLLVKVSLDNTKISYELFPTISPRSKPYLMKEGERSTFLENLASRSSVSLQSSIKTGVLHFAR